MSVSEPRIGADAPRIDAVEKVTGLQRYAADRRPDGLLHAVTVPATIARGRILAIDTTAAAAVPGAQSAESSRRGLRGGRCHGREQREEARGRPCPATLSSRA